VIFYVAYLFIDARVHGVAAVPIAWYKISFLLVFLAIFLPAVLSVAVFGREPRYWSVLLARTGKPGASEMQWRSRISPWAHRIASLVFVAVTVVYAALITLEAIARSSSTSTWLLIVLSWCLAIGVVIACARWWRHAVAHRGDG
jgi:hypothetical protein